MPATLPGNIIFAAGWETGTLLRGSSATPKGFNGSSGSPAVIADSTIIPGYTHVARFSVDASKYDGYGDRSEVQGSTNEVEGQERWYRWSVKFPSNFPTYGGFQVVGQWHSALDGSPPMGFYVDGGQYLQLVFNLASTSNPVNAAGQRNIQQYGFMPWRTLIKRGVPMEIVCHVKWSSSDSVAFIELWIDGVKQTFNGPNGDGSTKFFKRNTDPGYSHYYKQGYYRQHSTTQPDPIIFYYAGFQSSDGAGGGTVTFPGDPPPPEPPPPDPTVPGAPDSNVLGLTSFSGAWNNAQANSIRGSNATLEARQLVTGYRVLLRGSGTSASTQPFKVALFKVNDSNPLNDTLVPGSTSNEVLVANNASPAWVFFDVTDFNLDPGVYAVHVISGGTQYVQYAYASGGQLKWANDTYADGPANPWASQSSTVNGVDTTVGICAYALLSAPDPGGGTQSLQGAIVPTPNQQPGDFYFRGNLTPQSATAITNVANFGEEIISFRVPVIYAVDPVTNAKLFRVKWDGTKFVAYDS